MSAVPFMPSRGQVTTGPRQAALFLHAMTGPDREWLLGHLEPRQRSQLEDMLREIRALGIPPVPDFLRDELRPSPTQEAVAALSPARPSSAAAASLEQLSPKLVQARLCDEPDSLVISVLSRTGVRWRRAVLAEFEVPRRERLQRVLHRTKVGGARHSRLQLEIEARLIARCSSHGDTGLPRQPPFWALARRLRRFIRQRTVAGMRSSVTT